MKKLWTISLCLIAMVGILTGCFVIGDHLVNAQSADLAYTGDAEEKNTITTAYENKGSQSLSSDTEVRILIHTGPDGMVMRDPISLYVKGVPNTYIPDENGIVSLMVDLSMGDVMIEPVPVMWVEYIPESITIESDNVQSLYELWRMDLDTNDEGVGFTLVDKSAEENEAFTAAQKVTLPKGERARLELALPATYPNGVIYYGFSTTTDANGVDHYDEYTGVIEITENTTICAYADESAVGGAESQRLCRLIEFRDSDDPDNNPGNGSGNDNDHTNKSDPNKDVIYKDDFDNEYTNEDVSLRIEPIADYADYEAIIKDFPEFKYITSDHVNFLDVKLLAEDVEVQPEGSYELILPYPDGSEAKDEFVLYHFINGTLDSYENVNFTAEADGLHCRITSTGTFVIGWKVAAAELPDPDASNADDNESSNEEVLENRANNTGGINTGDTSNPRLWLMICIGEIALGIFYVRKKRNTGES